MYIIYIQYFYFVTGIIAVPYMWAYMVKINYSFYNFLYKPVTFPPWIQTQHPFLENSRLCFPSVDKLCYLYKNQSFIALTNCFYYRCLSLCSLQETIAQRKYLTEINTNCQFRPEENSGDCSTNQSIIHLRNITALLSCM